MTGSTSAARCRRTALLSRPRSMISIGILRQRSSSANASASSLNNCASFRRKPESPRRRFPSSSVLQKPLAVRRVVFVIFFLHSGCWEPSSPVAHAACGGSSLLRRSPGFRIREAVHELEIPSDSPLDPSFRFATLGMLGIEPRLRTPEARVLPLYYTPFYIFLPAG